MISLILINPISPINPICPADSSRQHATDRMDVMRICLGTGKQTA